MNKLFFMGLNVMKQIFVFIFAGIAHLFAPINQINADVTVTIAEVGSSIEYSYSAGTLDTTGLTLFQQFGATNQFFSLGPDANAIGGGASEFVQSFEGNIAVTTSSGWIQNGNIFPWSSISGSGGLFGSSDYFGVGPLILIGDDPGEAIVGVNNLSGVNGTLVGETFESVGLAPNEFIRFSWAADTLTFQTIGAIPEPSSFLVLVGLGGIFIFRRRKARR